MPVALPPVTPADINVFFEGGKYLFRVDESRSIYVYDRDRPRKSACTAECARQWPPVLPSLGAKAVGDWTLLKRADGLTQWCYRNRPIYTYANDKPGVTSGDGIDGLWHVVVP